MYTIPDMLNPESNRHSVMFVHIERQGENLEYFREHCHPIDPACDFLRVDDFGNIFYSTWRQIRGVPSTNIYKQISHTSPLADITAQNTRYKDTYEIQIHQIQEDEGSIEAAIRAMRHVIENQEIRQLPQTLAIKQRALELMNLYEPGFAELNDQQLRQEQAKTEQILKDAHLFPSPIIAEEKRRTAQWLIKGSSGIDDTGRKNKMISMCSLLAAARRAINREHTVGFILEKYLHMQQILIMEEARCKMICAKAEEKFRPTGLAATKIFQGDTYYPRYRYDHKTLCAMLFSLRDQLKSLHVKPYRDPSQQAAIDIHTVIQLIGQAGYQDVIDQQLFDAIHEQLILVTPDTSRQIYP